MSTKTQKIVAAITATALAASVVLGGTLAWQSINQEATNIVSGTVNPGGRLHDDFDGNNNNKDIYVENFADQDIYARIQLREYLEIGTITPGTAGTLVIPAAAAGKSDATTAANVDSWAIHYYDDTQNETDQYVDFTWGGSTTYLPTFNMNKDSLLADINGTYEGLYPDGSEPTGTIEDDRYADYIDYADAQYANGVTGYEVWDADLDDDDEVGENVDTVIDRTGTYTTFADAVAPVLSSPADYTTSYTEVIKDQTAKATHIPTTTRTATVISMAEWKQLLADGKAETFYGWVYDTDGWAYWSQPIEPKTVDAQTGAVTSDNTTGLLLDAITPRIDDNYYYQIHVIAQFITANDLGQTDGTGFFAAGKGSNPSADALALLNTIGVNISGGSTLSVTSNAASVAPGGSVQLTATNPTTGAAVTGATWILNGSNVASTFSTTPATETAIDPDTGVLTVATNETASKLTAIAIFADTDTKSTLIGSYDIIVSVTATAPTDEYTVEISEATGATTIYAGGTLNFSAKVSKNGQVDSALTVDWDVTGGASQNTSITGGVLSVDAGEAVDTVLTVTATYTDTTTSETYTDEYEVTVVADAYTVAITGDDTIAAGTGTKTYTAEVKKNGQSDSSAVTWTVEGGTASSIDATSGGLTIGAAETENEVTVKATSSVDSTAFAEKKVTVTHSRAVEVTAAGGVATVAAGAKLQFSAKVTNNGVEFSPTGGVTWSVTELDGVSISDSGLLSVSYAVANDTPITVTATFKADSSVSHAATVTVVNTLTDTQRTIVTAAEGTKVTIDGIEYWVVVQDTAKQRALLWKATPVGQTTGINGTTMDFDADSAAWSGSDMQIYLNNDYKTSLYDELEEDILSTTIKTASRYDRSGTYVETTDSVFLLTEADVFGTYHDGSASQTATNEDEYTYVRDNTPAAIVTTDMKGWTPESGTSTLYAWLRSPRRSSGNVAMVTSNGGVSFNNYWASYYVRPAFWVSLAS